MVGSASTATARGRDVDVGTDTEAPERLPGGQARAASEAVRWRCQTAGERYVSIVPLPPRFAAPMSSWQPRLCGSD
jgi:hypothetical protein